MAPLPNAIETRLTDLDSLSRAQRADLGRDLRRLGLSLSEISNLVERSKSTVSAWCKDVPLTENQALAIAARTGAQPGVARDTQWRRRLEIDAIRSAARGQVSTLLGDPLWVAGTMLYWGEGSKTSNALGLSNSDPTLHRIFVKWVREYVQADPVFVLKLNLHVDNDESEARAYWTREVEIPDVRFYRTYIKPEGSGYRKNTLPYGVCQTRVRASADGLHRVLGWIEGLALQLPTS